MNTDDLISQLSKKAAPAPFNPMQLGVQMVGAIVLPVVVFLTVAGTRPHMALAWENPVVPFKTILPAITFAVSVTLLLRLARPEARPGRLPLGYVVPAAVALALWVGAFVLRAPSARFAEVGVKSLAECLGLNLALAIIPTFVALRVIRRGASSTPMLSGALAGLTAASGTTVGYSMFCTQDNPLFFVTWYGLAMVVVTISAARIGRRWLAW